MLALLLGVEAAAIVWAASRLYQATRTPAPIIYSLKDEVSFPTIQSSTNAPAAGRPVPDHGPDLRPSLDYFYEPPAGKTLANHEKPYSEGIVTINADALNERGDYAAAKPAGTFRILTLGDSYVYGLFVGTRDNWTERLEDLLNGSDAKCRVEVINLGVPGYDLQYAVERYRRRGAKYSPDLVLWLVKDDDFFGVKDILNARAAEIESQARGNPQNPTRPDPYGEWLAANEDLMDRYGKERLVDFAQARLEEFFKLYSGRVVFLTMKPFLGKSTNLALHDCVKRHPSASLWEIGEIYDRKDNYFSAFGDFHPNKTGHERIARGLSDRLKFSGFLR